MVPTPWFEVVAEFAREQPDFDLTLTSESDHLKWGPVTSPGPDTRLTDHSGHFWKTVRQVRDRADPDAVRRELQAQIEQALSAGIRVSHLDHHMGAAVSPEFVEATIALGSDRHDFVSLHCSAPGEIELVHPGSSRRRIEEYRLFRDAEFVAWLAAQDVEPTNFRVLARSSAETG